MDVKHHVYLLTCLDQLLIFNYIFFLFLLFNFKTAILLKTETVVILAKWLASTTLFLVEDYKLRTDCKQITEVWYYRGSHQLPQRLIQLVYTDLKQHAFSKQKTCHWNETDDTNKAEENEVSFWYLIADKWLLQFLDVMGTRAFVTRGDIIKARAVGWTFCRQLSDRLREWSN